MSEKILVRAEKTFTSLDLFIESAPPLVRRYCPRNYPRLPDASLCSMKKFIELGGLGDHSGIRFKEKLQFD